MLKKLSVRNYVLISDLEVDFSEGFNVITGETGSGKSLLLGALGLLLGQQADFSKIGDPTKKCVSEGYFQISDYSLEYFFEENDIDYEPVTIVRRELSKSGKSRAFINDTPVKLSVLKSFTSDLIDIHSQHENSKVHDRDFLFEVLDAFSEIGTKLDEYRSNWTKLKSLDSEFKELLDKEALLKADRDYYHFQLKELSEIPLEDLNLVEMEQELNILDQAEEIRENMYRASDKLSQDEAGALVLIKQAEDDLRKIKNADAEINALTERLSNAKLELEDLAFDIHRKHESISPDEERLLKLTDLVNQLNTLMMKHRVASVSELIVKRNEFLELVNKADNYDDVIAKLRKKIEAQNESTAKLALRLTKARNSKKGELEVFVNDGLADLSMPQAEFKVDVSEASNYSEYGKDQVRFLIRTNKGSEFTEINKGASGGEISRIMFLIKAAIASKKSIKTLVLDEIDAGISGEVASKLANQIRHMGNSSQLLVVTHLAQMASKATSHYKVSKTTENDNSETKLYKLETKAQVLNELAQILSGETVTEAALKNAASLLSEN